MPPIIDDVNAQWHARQAELLAAYEGDTRKQIVEMSTGYVQFLAENPHLRAILTLKDRDFDNVYHRVRGELSSPTQRLIQRYCQEEQLDEETRQRKVYVVRSLIFGAAIQFDNGELPYSEHTLKMVTTALSESSCCRDGTGTSAPSEHTRRRGRCAVRGRGGEGKDLPFSGKNALTGGGAVIIIEPENQLGPLGRSRGSRAENGIRYGSDDETGRCRASGAEGAAETLRQKDRFLTRLRRAKDAPKRQSVPAENLSG